MTVKNTVYGYGSVAKALHWLSFLMIAGLLTVGFIMADMKPSPDMFKLYNIHKSMGILLLMVVGVRLLWKAVNVVPVLPQGLHKMEKFLAHAGHALLYVLMIAMPLSGWIMSSAAGFSVSVFGWFTMPDLIAPQPEIKHTMEEVHEFIAWVIIAMVGLHVLAALLHHFYYRNNVLRRMLPFVKEVTEYERQSVKESDTLTGC